MVLRFTGLTMTRRLFTPPVHSAAGEDSSHDEASLPFLIRDAHSSLSDAWGQKDESVQLAAIPPGPLRLLKPVGGELSALFGAQRWIALSAAAAVPIYTTSPHSLSPALLSTTDEFHECPFQEPRGLETQEFSWQSDSITTGQHRPHRTATTDVALAAGFEFEQLLAPHEPAKSPGPPALVHVRAVWRPWCAQPAAWPPCQPAAAHQHRRTGRLSPATAHGLPPAGRPAWISSRARRRTVWAGIRCTTAQPGCASWAASAIQAAWAHGRAAGRGPLQGTADCRY